MTEDELMRELEKDIDAPDMFSIDYVKPIEVIKDIKLEGRYLCIGEFRIELDNRTPLQKAKSRYYFKKKSNGI